MRRFFFGLSLLLALSITACGPESGASITQTGPGSDSSTTPETPEDSLPPEQIADLDSTDSEAMQQFIKGEFSVAKAMEVIYGLYDKDIECSRWVCKPREEKSFASKISNEGVLFTRPSGVYDIKDNDGKRKLLLTETLARGKEGWESCHACAPIVGAALFMEVEGDWFIEALRKDLSEIGAWGEMPPHELVQIGPQSWGVRLDYGYTNQGITEGGMELLGMAKDRFHVLANLHTNYSNEGMFFEGQDSEEAYSYSSQISFEPGDNVEHWDMIVKTKGSKPMGEEGVIEDFEETRRFAVEGTEYVEISSESSSARPVM
jgi:hypothetical protein